MRSGAALGLESEAVSEQCVHGQALRKPLCEIAHSIVAFRDHAVAVHGARLRHALPGRASAGARGRHALLALGEKIDHETDAIPACSLEIVDSAAGRCSLETSAGNRSPTRRQAQKRATANTVPLVMHATAPAERVESRRTSIVPQDGRRVLASITRISIVKNGYVYACKTFYR